jgi:hypothetical protein
MSLPPVAWACFVLALASRELARAVGLAGKLWLTLISSKKRALGVLVECGLAVGAVAAAFLVWGVDTWTFSLLVCVANEKFVMNKRAESISIHFLAWLEFTFN